MEKRNIRQRADALYSDLEKQAVERLFKTETTKYFRVLSKRIPEACTILKEQEKTEEILYSKIKKRPEIDELYDQLVECYSDFVQDTVADAFCRGMETGIAARTMPVETSGAGSKVIEEAERIRKQLQQKMCPEEEALLEEILARMKEWRAVLVRCAYAEGYASAVQVCRFRADFRENLEIKEKIIRTLMEIGDPCEEER